MCLVFRKVSPSISNSKYQTSQHIWIETYMREAKKNLKGSSSLIHQYFMDNSLSEGNYVKCNHIMHTSIIYRTRLFLLNFVTILNGKKKIFKKWWRCLTCPRYTVKTRLRRKEVSCFANHNNHYLWTILLHFFIFWRVPSNPSPHPCSHSRYRAEIKYIRSLTGPVCCVLIIGRHVRKTIIILLGLGFRCIKKKN